MEWTDKQLKIVLESACEADGGCAHCIRLVLKMFFELAGFDLIDRMEIISKKVKFRSYYTWKDICPSWESYEKHKPSDIKYIKGNSEY